SHLVYERIHFIQIAGQIARSYMCGHVYHSLLPLYPEGSFCGRGFPNVPCCVMMWVNDRKRKETIWMAEEIKRMLVELRADIFQWFEDTIDLIYETRYDTMSLTPRQWSLLLLAVAKEINEATAEELEDWEAIWRKLMEAKHGRGYDHEDI